MSRVCVVLLCSLPALAPGAAFAQTVAPRATLDTNDYAHRNLALAFTNDSKTLASGGMWGWLKLWRVEEGELLADLTDKDVCEVPPEVSALAFSPDCKTLAIAGKGEDKRFVIQLWDVEKQKVRASLAGHTKDIWALSYSADGKTLAFGGWDRSVCLWDVKTGKVRSRLDEHGNSVLSLALSADGKSVAVGCYDELVYVWDAQTGKLRHTLKGHRNCVDSVAICPESKLLASGGRGGDVKLWDLTTGELLHKMSGKHVAFTADGKHLITVYGSEIVIWDCKAGNGQVVVSIGQTSRAAVISPDGKTLAVTGDDGPVRLWDVAQLMKKLD